MKRITIILLLLNMIANTAYAQTYCDEGPTLTPNAFGLVYENAISENRPGQVQLHHVTQITTKIREFFGSRL